MNPEESAGSDHVDSCDTPRSSSDAPDAAENPASTAISIERLLREPDERRTVIIKQLPARLSQDKLRQYLTAEMPPGEVVGVSMPAHKGGRNGHPNSDPDFGPGYAFVRLKSQQGVIELYKQWHGREWKEFKSKKKSVISFAKDEMIMKRESPTQGSASGGGAASALPMLAYDAPFLPAAGLPLYLPPTALVYPPTFIVHQHLHLHQHRQVAHHQLQHHWHLMLQAQWLAQHSHSYAAASGGAQMRAIIADGSSIETAASSFSEQLPPQALPRNATDRSYWSALPLEAPTSLSDGVSISPTLSPTSPTQPADLSPPFVADRSNAERDL